MLLYVIGSRSRPTLLYLLFRLYSRYVVSPCVACSLSVASTRMLTVDARKQTAECAPIIRMQPPAAVRSLERGQTAQPELAAKPKAPFLQLERAAT